MHLEREGVKYTGLSINSHYSCGCGSRSGLVLRGTIVVAPVVGGLILTGSNAPVHLSLQVYYYQT